MSEKTNKIVVLMSDFGTRERFVASMKGVALGVDAGTVVFSQSLPYVKSFGFVEAHAPLLYVDSVQQAGLALNAGDFAAVFDIHAGPEWRIELRLNH